MEKTPDKYPKQFKRESATSYLKNEWDLDISRAALAQHDARGTGPERRTVLRRVYYSREALDRWVLGMAARASSGEQREAAP